MMLRLIAKILYVYYNTGSNKGVAYTRTIVSIGMVFYMNLLTVLGIIDLDLISLFDFTIKDRGPAIKYLSGFFTSIPMMLLFVFLIPKKKVLQVRLSPKQAKLGKRIVLIYILLSFIALIYVGIKNNV